MASRLHTFVVSCVLVLSCKLQELCQSALKQAEAGSYYRGHSPLLWQEQIALLLVQIVLCCDLLTVYICFVPLHLLCVLVSMVSPTRLQRRQTPWCAQHSSAAWQQNAAPNTGQCWGPSWQTHSAPCQQQHPCYR